MIANSLTVMVGLWLSYKAIFSIPTGELGQVELTTIGAVLIVLALLARRTDAMTWQSGTNLVLGAAVLAAATARYLLGPHALLMFWTLLLIAITASITAMWSILYRPEVERPAGIR